jgi:hypothetical protein
MATSLTDVIYGGGDAGKKREENKAKEHYRRYFGEAVDDPKKLMELSGIWRNEAARRRSPDSQQYTDRAVQVERAIKDLYGIDYTPPGFLTRIPQGKSVPGGPVWMDPNAQNE